MRLPKLWPMLMGLWLAACVPVTPTPMPTPTVLPLRGRITFAGSTTVQPLAGKLGEVFTQLYPHVELDIAAGGSVVGIQAVHDGTTDIGMASRALSDEEAAGIEQYQIAIDVLAVVVHADNPVNNLSPEQLAAIYRGEVSNWQAVGGADLAMTPVSREESSGTRGAFDELVLDGEAPTAPALRIAITAGDVAAAVADDPAAIGYVGFGNLDANLKVLSINGVAPSPETARDGSYHLLRPLLLLTGPLTQPLAHTFIDFVLSDEGQVLVTEDGWVPAH